MDYKAIEDAHRAAKIAEEMGCEFTASALWEVAQTVELVGPPHPHPELSNYGKLRPEYEVTLNAQARPQADGDCQMPLNNE